LSVEDLTDRTILQNCKWIFSIHSKHHVSEEYKKIGVTKESKNFNWRSTGMAKL
jgi:hypothetical protein